MEVRRSSFPTADAPGPFRQQHRRGARPQAPCPCGCGHADGFCDTHRERLARIRSTLFDGGGKYAQRVDVRGYKAPRCCLPSCDEPRRRGEKFCLEHADEIESAE